MHLGLKLFVKAYDKVVFRNCIFTARLIRGWNCSRLTGLIRKFGKIKVYVRKLFKLINDGKKEERQCTLKGQAWYVNVQGSVHWKGLYRVGNRDLGVQNL